MITVGVLVALLGIIVAVVGAVIGEKFMKILKKSFVNTILFTSEIFMAIK